VKTKAPRWLPALLVAVGVWTAAVVLHGAAEPFELRTLDWRMRTMRRPESFRSDIVFINLSQSSLNYGRKEQQWGWPWPREVWADIVTYAAQGGAKIFVSDIGFTEDDLHGPENDQRLGQAAAKFGRFLIATPFTSDTADDGPLPDEFVRRFSVPVKGTPSALDVFIVPPVEEIWMGARRVVAARLRTDDDGIHRRYPLLFRCRGAYYPSMALGALIEMTGAKEIAAEPGAVTVGDVRIPVDREGCFILTYDMRDVDVVRHDAGVTISSAIRKRGGKSYTLGPEVFKDKAVFLAAWAPGLLDFRPTPLSGAEAAAVVHGTALSNLLQRRFLRRVATPSALALLAALMVAIALATRFLKPSVGAPIALLLLAAWFGSAILAYRAGFWLDLVTPTVAGVVTFGAVSALNYALEGRQRARVKRAFQQYVSPAVVDKILKNPDGLKLEGDRKPLTIMFLDFAGFTTLSQSLDPVELCKTLNEYNNETVSEIHKYDGTLDKFIGDAVMAFWNDPLELPDPEARACLAAIGIQERLGELAVKMRQRGLPEMHARVGINSGVVTVGNMGSNAQFNYTAIGDDVNLASRVEGVNKEFGTNIIATESTYSKARDRVEARQLALIQVKGRDTSVRIYEVLGRKGEVPAERMAKARAFEAALEQLYRRDWDGARKAFEAVGDAASKVYIEVCDHYRTEPPPAGWDGTYVMTHK